MSNDEVDELAPIAGTRGKVVACREEEGVRLSGNPITACKCLNGAERKQKSWVGGTVCVRHGKKQECEFSEDVRKRRRLLG